jgi:hypothetical protein
MTEGIEGIEGSFSESQQTGQPARRGASLVWPRSFWQKTTFDAFGAFGHTVITIETHRRDRHFVSQGTCRTAFTRFTNFHFKYLC